MTKGWLTAAAAAAGGDDDINSKLEVWTDLHMHGSQFSPKQEPSKQDDRGEVTQALACCRRAPQH